MKCVILYNLRSAHNVGSIFRTADGAGVSKIYLIDTTPAPIDRFGRKRKDIAKVALGAEESVEWEYAKDIFSILENLREEDSKIVAVEQDEQSTTLSDFSPQEKTAYIFGSETKGLPEEVLNEADTILEIPMKGKKESLNVSVAAGIILFSNL